MVDLIPECCGYRHCTDNAHGLPNPVSIRDWMHRALTIPDMQIADFI
jgi:hypothetical protein